MSVRKRKWKTSSGDTREAWVCDYFDQHGDRILKTFDRKKDADAYHATVKVDVRHGVHTAPAKSISVTEAAERWIAEGESNGLEFGTLKQRREHLHLHIKPYLGREKLSSLTMPRCYQFDANMRANGRSLAMRRKVMTNLKTILSFAQSQGLVAQNVARGVKIKGDDRQAGAGPIRDGHDFPSRAELRTIMDKATGRWRPLIITAIFTGMRASELRGLTWNNVDLDQGMIHVRQRADAWGNIGRPKSAAGSRDIPLTPMAVNALKDWKKVCPAGEQGLVFPNGRGNVESHQNILNRCWIPLQIKNGMAVDSGKRDADGNPILAAKYGFHAIRHAAASLFIAHLGWPPKRVQAVMGHASMAMTYDRYGHLFADSESDREAMKRLEAAVVAV